jgi:hypothetical protein
MQGRQADEERTLDVSATSVLRTLFRYWSANGMTYSIWWSQLILYTPFERDLRTLVIAMHTAHIIASRRGRGHPRCQSFAVVLTALSQRAALSNLNPGYVKLRVNGHRNLGMSSQLGV